MTFADTHTGPPSSYNRQTAATTPAPGTITADQRDTRDPRTLGSALADRPTTVSITTYATTLDRLTR